MTKPPRKQRLSVYLDPSVMNRLADHAARRDHSRSLVAEAAIESFLSPDAAERQEAVITKRLDQLDRRMSRMERDIGISVEMLAVFVRFWVTTTPSLPESLRRGRVAMGSLWCVTRQIGSFTARRPKGCAAISC